jgi:hypothetical protein
MNKNKKGFTLIIITLIVLFLIGIVIMICYKLMTEPQKIETNNFDHKNCSYVIEGKNITLKNGYSEELIPNSNSKTITQYFGNEKMTDLNNDGLNDVVFILTQTMGGSGTFYYLAVALRNDECKGTNAILLGDRIAPQGVEIRDNNIFVNYADRKAEEAMTSSPSIGITKEFVLNGNTLKDITTEEAKKEQSCLMSGGTIESSICCTSTSDFPNLCLVGACGCSPTNSHQVKTCICGEDKCFNGDECAPLMR